VGEIVNHHRGHDLYIVAFAGINEDVGFNHRYVAEETINVLRRDQSNLPGFDQVIQGGHAFALADFLGAAHACVHINHEHVLTYPALSQQMFNHIHCLQGGGDIANLPLR